LNDYRKLFLFLILLVVLPSILLSIFAINALVGQKILIEKKIKGSYSALALSTRRRIFDEMKRRTQEIEDFVKKSQQTSSSINISQFPLDNSFFSQVFLINNDYEIIYPEPRPLKFQKQRIKIIENFNKFGDGYKLEFEKNTKEGYKEAIEEYNSIVNKERDQNFKSAGHALVVMAHGLFAIARCYLKLKQFEEALDTYHLIPNLFSNYVNAMELHFIVKAKLQIASTQKQLQQFQASYITTLEILEQIIYNEYRLELEEYLYYKESIQQLLTELEAKPSFLAKEKEQLHRQYQEIVKKQEKHVSQESALEMAKSYIIPKLKKLGPEIFRNTNYMSYRDKNEWGLSYVIQIPEIPDNRELIVCPIDLQQCIEQVINPIIETQDLGKDITIMVVDRDEPSIQERSFPVATVSMEPVLPFLEIVVDIKNIRSLDDLTRYQSYLYFGGIVIVILVLFVGVCGFIVTLIREVKGARLKSDFVSNITHELKTPLTAIKMFVETLLMERTRSQEEQKECLQIISSESDRLSRLIDRILDFAKMAQKKRIFQFSIENVGEVVENTVEQFKKQILEQNCDIKVSIEEGLPAISIDRQAIIEALINLLSNAYKYTNHNKKIEIICYRRKNDIAIKIKDNGIGIPRHEFQRIFQKFYRIDSTLTRKVEGTGLGLSLVTSLVKVHNGKVKIQSRVGVGSEFTIRLPIQENSQS